MAHHKNWIAGAIKHPGALRRTLGAKSGKSIKPGALFNAAKGKGVSPTTKKRAVLAETLKSFHHKKAPKEEMEKKEGKVEHKHEKSFHMKMHKHHKGIAEHHEKMSMHHKKMGDHKSHKHHKGIASHHHKMAKHHKGLADAAY